MQEMSGAAEVSGVSEMVERRRADVGSEVHWPPQNDVRMIPITEGGIHDWVLRKVRFVVKRVGVHLRIPTERVKLHFARLLLLRRATRMVFESMAMAEEL